MMYSCALLQTMNCNAMARHETMSQQCPLPTSDHVNAVMPTAASEHANVLCHASPVPYAQNTIDVPIEAEKACAPHRAERKPGEAKDNSTYG